jgi:iduronate 2-sulfatase
MFAADDLRPQLNCFEPMEWLGDHVRMSTPHTDELASRAGSVVFAKAYCQQALCGPTRASLLTGRRPDTTNVHTIGPYWRSTGGNFTSLPQHFRQSGYSVHGIGKIFHPGRSSGGSTDQYINPGPAVPWVLGDDYPHSWTTGDPELPDYYHAPNKMYWQCSAAPGYNTTCDMHHRTTPSFQSVNRSEEAAVPLMDVQIADQAIHSLGVLASRINRSRAARAAAGGNITGNITGNTTGDITGKPFFLAVGFHLPHLPDLVPQRYVELYADPGGLPDEQLAAQNMPTVAWSSSSELKQYSDARKLSWHGAVNTSTPANFTRALRRHYYGAVSFIDHQVGRVLAALQSSGLQDSTVVVLWGDHGYHLGEHGMWCKTTNFEDDTHAPLIVSWPGSKQPPVRSTAFAEFVDIFPTLADLAGIAVPPLCPQDSSGVELCTEGTSLRPVFEGSSAEVKRAAFSQFPHGSPAARMGYSMVTRIAEDGAAGNPRRLAAGSGSLHEVRYTEWPRWIGDPGTKGRPDWTDVDGRELYNHTADPQENYNVVGAAGAAGLVAALSRQLRAGWRAATINRTSSSGGGKKIVELRAAQGT